MKLPFSFRPNCSLKLILQKKGVIVGCYLLFLAPIALLIIHVCHRIDHLKILEGKIKQVTMRMEHARQFEQERSAVLNRFEEIDPEYIQHVLEPMVFLRSEVEMLQLLSAHPAFHTYDIGKFCRGENRLSFSEKNREVKNGIEEVTFSQEGPVEIDVEDLQRILSAIEGVKIGDQSPSKKRPYLIVKRFSLNKKKEAERETYCLEMELIKRRRLK